jgi:hypothetical protein
VGDRVPARAGRSAPQARPRLRTLFLLGLLVGCGPRPDPPEESTPTPEEPTTAEATPEPEPLFDDDDDSARLPESQVPLLHLKPIGLAPLYQRFFADEVATDNLRQRLGRTFEGAGSVAVEVTWNDHDKAGSITLFVPEMDRTGERLADAIVAGDPVPVQRLAPLMRPLAKYREELASRYDLRILSFDIRLAFWDRRTGSHCSIGGAVGDPEGRKLGPCFRCLDPRAGGRVEVCRDGEAWPARVEGEKKTIRQVQSALRSNPL